MVQTSASKKRGGRSRRLRQVQLRVIFSKDGWVGKQDDANTAHWQVRLDSGWDMMADSLNSNLSTFVEKNGNAGVVTLKHHWTNPGGRSKTTEYSFHLDQMTQQNPDSGTTREIRQVSMTILPSPQTSSCSEVSQIEEAEHRRRQGNA